MIHMVVDDTLSSLPPSYRSFRNLEMSSGKRARSPEESGSDRPSVRILIQCIRILAAYLFVPNVQKKPTLAITEIAGRVNDRHLSVSSASSSRQPSEDWVQQTGGLTINSPLYAASEHDHSFVSHSGGNTGDVDMVRKYSETLGLPIYCFEGHGF